MDAFRIRHAVAALGLAAAYYGAAKLGLSLAFATPSVTAVWAPTGISLAVLILFGLRLWPGVALGAFAANLGTGVPLYTVLGITTGNTLEAVVGAYLLLRVVDFRPRLDRVIDVVWLVVLGAGVSTTISATIGTSSLLAGGEINGGDFGSVLRTWWLGDMGGDLIVAPFLMVAVSHWPYRIAQGRLLEAGAIALGSAGAAALVFTQDQGLGFLLLPLGMLAVFRFRQPGAVSLVMALATVAIPLTNAGHGPYGHLSPDDRLELTTLFLGTAGVSSLVLAAVLSERQRLLDSFRSIATTLQEGLVPSSLPAIPGVETAVEFRPAGERQIVGGDFYDVIAAGDGSYGVVIGDALGKGAGAAADTARARYTLRAAAASETEPSRILGALNEAILHQAPGHPCTVAYARLEPNASGARITVALGGHPKPLILRTDGSVEPIGHAALPLGVRQDLELTEQRAELHAGDGLVLYTDGLTDAHAPKRVLSSAQLADALRPYGGAEPRRIVAAAREVALGSDHGSDPRDDILVLVLSLTAAPTPA